MINKYNQDWQLKFLEKNDLEHFVTKAILKQLDSNEPIDNLDSTLSEIGIDSVDQISILLMFEDLLKKQGITINIPTDKLESVVSISDFINFVYNILLDLEVSKKTEIKKEFFNLS